MPQNDDGTRIEPLVSEPSAIGTSPPPTAAPEPPDEPPVMRVGSWGLRDGPSCAFSPVKSYAYSPMLSAPTMTAPAASRRSISVASRVDGGRSRLIFEPARVARPLMSNRFFTAKGTPASGPALVPPRITASTARARARARSAVTSVKAFSVPLCFPIRVSAASVTSAADILRLATAFAMAEADGPPAADVRAMSGCVDTGGLDLVRKREFVDQARQPQRNFEIGAHRRPPGILDRKRQRLTYGVDIVIQ